MTKESIPKNRCLLEVDEIVSRLVPADKEVTDAVLLTGFLGHGRVGGCWRLYKAPELREYVEFKEDDVVHCEKTKSDLLPAGSLVWLKSTAVLERQQAKSRSIAAEFLSGVIIEEQVIGKADSLVDHGTTAITWTITITITITITTTIPTGGENTRRCCIGQTESAQSKCLCPS